MGHVDTGKTKLLDKIRRTNVQEGEAGGITQQIGATFFPDIALEEQTKKVDEDFELELPGMMIIDTPGHESFNNLRKRGSSLCDFAILVIDIMHGLEPQTVESLDLLRKRKCPFIIALNKIDRCHGWKSEHYTSVRSSLARQNESVHQEFNTRLQNVMLQLNERGLNVSLYWENEDLKSTVCIVPTSAMTGEGVPDLLYKLLSLSQKLIPSQLEVQDELNCTVIEVKNIEGLGTTIDVVLVSGTLREGDTIVLAGLGGPIVTQIRALLTPAPMKEMRVKADYIHHAKIDVSMGIKISAPGLEEAVAGTELKVLPAGYTAEDLEEAKEEVQESPETILLDGEKQTTGVYVKASTLGSLEALLAFLQESKIPVFDVGIGEVQKKDVKKTCVMKDKGHPEYAVILAFDVKVNNEAQTQADKDGVQIMTADIIYHLFDRFTQYMDKFRESKKSETRNVAVFPVVMEIEKDSVFRKKDPLIMGCKIVGGQLRPGTPICVPEKDFLVIGHVSGIEKDKKEHKIARRGETVCVKIEQTTAQNHLTYGRHFDHLNRLYSNISRESIDTLKEHFKDEMKKEDWELIIGMKTIFKIS
jgi:translation initiation factor aIF-2/yIF-2